MRNVCFKAIEEYLEIREREKEMSKALEQIGLEEKKDGMEVDDE